MILFADSPDVGECTDDIEAAVDGEFYATAFNGEYMHNVLSVCGKQVTIEQNGPNSALVVYTSDKKDSECHLIMPLHIDATIEEDTD